ncbi:MAG: hypothetical protein AB7O24_18370 [Kofleriaceae bacterium]
MKKLAFLAFALGACVDELPSESARVATAETGGTFATEVEIFNDYGESVDIATVEITGFEVRPRDFNDSIDPGRPGEFEANAGFKELCAVADEQPTESACSLVCDLPKFAARMITDRELCRSVDCPTENGGIATVLVCPSI